MEYMYACMFRLIWMNSTSLLIYQANFTLSFGVRPRSFCCTYITNNANKLKIESWIVMLYFEPRWNACIWYYIDITWVMAFHIAVDSTIWPQRVLAYITGNTKLSHNWTFAREIHRWSVDYHHRGPVMWKSFPCHDVIILRSQTVTMEQEWHFQRKWTSKANRSHKILSSILHNAPDSKVHGANTGPIWGRQDPGGPHIGPMNLAIWGHLVSGSVYIVNLYPPKPNKYYFLSFHSAYWWGTIIERLVICKYCGGKLFHEWLHLKMTISADCWSFLQIKFRCNFMDRAF